MLWGSVVEIHTVFSVPLMLLMMIYFQIVLDWIHQLTALPLETVTTRISLSSFTSQMMFCLFFLNIRNFFLKGKLSLQAEYSIVYICLQADQCYSWLPAEGHQRSDHYKQWNPWLLYFCYHGELSLLMCLFKWTPCITVQSKSHT